MIAPAALVAAARVEVADRERHYPAMVASRKLPADEANADWQAWHAILAWLERGRSPAGMVEGSTGREDEARLPLIVVDWLLCEAGAARSVAQFTEAVRVAPDDEQRAALAARLEAVRAIANRVRTERKRIEALTRAWREHRARQRQKGRKPA